MAKKKTDRPDFSGIVSMQKAFDEGFDIMKAYLDRELEAHDKEIAALKSEIASLKRSIQ